MRCSFARPFCLTALCLPFAIVTFGSVAHAQFDYDSGKDTVFQHSETLPWWLSGQGNFIFQWHPRFHADYSGPNSFEHASEQAASEVVTLYGGLQMSPTIEALVDVESAGGSGLSQTLGLAGFANVDAVRNPSLGAEPYLARLEYRKVIPLSDDTIDVERSPLSILTQLAGSPARHPRRQIRPGRLLRSEQCCQRQPQRFHELDGRKQRRLRLRGGHARLHLWRRHRLRGSLVGFALRRGSHIEARQWAESAEEPAGRAFRELRTGVAAEPDRETQHHHSTARVHQFRQHGRLPPGDRSVRGRKNAGAGNHGPSDAERSEVRIRHQRRSGIHRRYSRLRSRRMERRPITNRSTTPK